MKARQQLARLPGPGGEEAGTVPGRYVKFFAEAGRAGSGGRIRFGA